jgi:single-strand DNA-binding protein
MMAGINKAIIVGNVGRIESKATQSGSTVVNLSIATSYKGKDPQGQPIDITDWHNCVMFGKTAEIAQQYVTKGTKLYIEGALKTEKWQTENGETRYTTKVIVREMQMLGSKQDGNAPETPQNAYSTTKTNQPSTMPSYPENNFIDDEIPF